MNQIFLTLLDMSMTASIIILAVCLVRLCLRRLPKRYSFLLWTIVGIRLLVPISVTSPISIFNIGIFSQIHSSGREMQTWLQGNLSASQNLTEQKDTAKPGGIAENMTVQNDISEAAVVEDGTIAGIAGSAADDAINADGNLGIGVGENAALTENTAVVSASQHFLLMKRILTSAGWIWFTGMILLFGYSAIQYLGMKKHIRTAVLLHDNIYECDDIGSPFVMGVFRTRIYIPFRLGEDERSYILLHEQYHIRRRDQITKLAAFVLLCVYWFNPLVWLAFFLMTRDMEMSCDEKVIEQLIGQTKSDIRRDYSTSLLSFATNRRQQIIGTLAFGETDTSKRVKNVLSFRRPKVWAMAAGILVIVAAAVLCLTNGLTEKKKLTIQKIFDQQESDQAGLTQQRGYEYALPEDAGSYMVYIEIYEQGVSEGQQMISYGELPAAYQSGSFEFQMDRQTAEKGSSSRLELSYTLGHDGYAGAYDLPADVDGSSFATGYLYDDREKHEIQYDTDYIMLAEYFGSYPEGEGQPSTEDQISVSSMITAYDCGSLMEADEEGFRHMMGENAVTVLVHLIFSTQKPEALYAQVTQYGELTAFDLVDSAETMAESSGDEDKSAGASGSESGEGADGEMDPSAVMLANPADIAQESFPYHYTGEVSNTDIIYSEPCPAATNISSPYGRIVNPVLGTERMHGGVDYAAVQGEDILAAADGVVYYTGEGDAYYGNTVVLLHENGQLTYYCCCSEILVSQGDAVSRGDLIARVGSTGQSTGSHLHFALSDQGEFTNPYSYMQDPFGKLSTDQTLLPVIQEVLHTMDQVASEEEQTEILTMLSELPPEAYTAENVIDYEENSQLGYDAEREPYLVRLVGTDDDTIVIYGMVSAEYISRGIIVDDQQKGRYYFDNTWDSMYSGPEMKLMDIDGDSSEEIVFCMTGCRGTGISTERLIIFKTNAAGALEAYEFSPEDILWEIAMNVEAHFTENMDEVRLISRSTNQELLATTSPMVLEEGQSVTGINYSNVYHFEITDDHVIYLCVSPGLQLSPDFGMYYWPAQPAELNFKVLFHGAEGVYSLSLETQSLSN